MFNSSSIALEQTPRRFVAHPERHLVYTIESDHRAYTQASKLARRKHLAEVFIATHMHERAHTHITYSTLVAKAATAGPCLLHILYIL